ncbi:Hypothetical_protein [Hexamita inflata]|uniref:Hypothetical_protein n=1 Tax=Hexamita inflata TaxID=28002 RepID=A0AA86RF29_9EUKA|nr:Hypothetical protein HINF_LOCUS64939 [Hexamita inflata]
METLQNIQQSLRAVNIDPDATENFDYLQKVISQQIPVDTDYDAVVNSLFSTKKQIQKLGLSEMDKYFYIAHLAEDLGISLGDTLDSSMKRQPTVLRLDQSQSISAPSESEQCQKLILENFKITFASVRCVLEDLKAEIKRPLVLDAKPILNCLNKMSEFRLESQNVLHSDLLQTQQQLTKTRSMIKSELLGFKSQLQKLEAASFQLQKKNPNEDVYYLAYDMHTELNQIKTQLKQTKQFVNYQKQKIDHQINKQIQNGFGLAPLQNMDKFKELQNQILKINSEQKEHFEHIFETLKEKSVAPKNDAETQTEMDQIKSILKKMQHMNNFVRQNETELRNIVSRNQQIKQLFVHIHGIQEAALE